MPRLRVAFALLALGLAIPTALLVERALSGVRAEREARHHAVAERAFDEMERVLSDFLRAEDERPFGQYAFAWTPEGAPTQVRVRSPLADPPAQPFVIGYFQIGADGVATSPLRPASAAEERRLGRAARGAEHEAALAHTLALAREVAARGRTVQLPPDEGAPAPRAAPAPKRERVAAAPPPAEAKPEPKEQPDAFDALQSLNLGAEARADRAQKIVAQEVAPEAAAPEAPPVPERIDAAPPPVGEEAVPEADVEAPAIEVAGPAREFREDAAAETDAQAGAERAAVEELVKRSLRADALAPPPATPGAPLADAAPAPPLPAPAPAAAETAEPATRDAEPEAPAARPRPRRVRVAVDPFVGRVADSGELILVRTVLVGERGVRQGIAIDRVRLADFLRAETLARSALPGSQLAFTLAGEARSAPEERRYAHRFAEPFDALAAELSLPPLAEGPGERAIEALALLLALAASFGLFALYRMVRTRLEFAERRSNFAAAVSHELKTPLTAIRMYGEMLRDGLVGSEEKRAEYYRAITAESERLSRLINNVLEFARIEKGARKGDVRVGDVRPVVEEALALLRPHAEKAGRRLVFECDAVLPAVRFERDALVQVLFNLVDNALKYARGASDPEIRVRCRPAQDGVEVSVRDHGPGVPREALARILEPFHRGEDELTRTTQGAGIGLALVKSLVHDMGAAFRVGNAEGGGFVASIELAAPAD